MYCIKCEKNIVTPIFDSDSDEEHELWSKRSHIIVYKGVIRKIAIGFGSKHDGDKMIIGICDDCIERGIEEGIILYDDNYQFKDDEYINARRESSKKAYRRRKNIDNLI